MRSSMSVSAFSSSVSNKRVEPNGRVIDFRSRETIIVITYNSSIPVSFLALSQLTFQIVFLVTSLDN